TVMAEAAPPILNTGNVTTADAARLAQRISAGEPLPQKKKTGVASAIGALIVAALVLGGGWQFLQQQNVREENPENLQDKQAEPAPVETQTVETAASVPEILPASEPQVSVPVVPDAPTEDVKQ